MEGLQLRHRVWRRKHASLHRGVPPAASRAHERWSIDFVFNVRLRDECLNARQFLSIEDARRKIEAWRVNCNLHRCHSSLGQLTHREYSRRSGIEYQGPTIL